jgi:hypothetical protein
MPILGIIASSNQSGRASGPISAYDALDSVTVSTATPTITFTNIPLGYKHLQLRGITLSANANNGVALRFNSDSASNYSIHGLEGNGITTTALSYGSANATTIPAGYTGDTTYPSAFVCDILDYASATKNTTIRAISGNADNAAGTRYAALLSGSWRSTAPVTSITITHGAAVNYNTYSTFALYGVK